MTFWVVANRRFNLMFLDHGLYSLQKQKDEASPIQRLAHRWGLPNQSQSGILIADWTAGRLVGPCHNRNQLRCCSDSGFLSRQGKIFSSYYRSKIFITLYILLRLTLHYSHGLWVPFFLPLMSRKPYRLCTHYMPMLKLSVAISLGWCLLFRVWGSFLETLDNFPGPVRIFSSSLIYQVMVIIGANLAICFTKL